MSQSPQQRRNSFELEALEPRVLLSADAFLATAVAANVVHKSTEVIHQAAAPDHGTVHDSLAYTPAEAGGIFAGVAVQAIQSHEPSPTSSGIQTKPATDIESGPNPDTAVQAKTVAATVVTTSTTNSANKISPTTTTTSAPSTTTSGSVATQQLTASLTVANAPPANTQTTVVKSVSNTTGSTQATSTTSFASKASPIPASPAVTTTDLWSTITGILTAANIANGTLPTGSTSYANVTIEGFLDFSNVAVTFTQSGGKGTAVTVGISGTATLLFPGGSNLISVTLGAVSGSFTTSVQPTGPSFKFSLSIASVTLNLGQALSVTTTSASNPAVTFNFSPNNSGVNADPDGASTTAVPLFKISTATATSPQFPGLGSATLTNFSLWTNGISFDNFSLTNSSVTIGNFFTATHGVTVPPGSPQNTTPVDVPVSLTATGGSGQQFNLDISNVSASTAQVSFFAPNVQLFPNVSGLNLSFSNVSGSFDVLDSTPVIDTSTGLQKVVIKQEMVNGVLQNVSIPQFTSTIGVGALSLAVGNVNISVGDAFTLHMSSVILTPGAATIATVTNATITSNLISGIPTFALPSSIVITQTGFTLSNLKLATGVTASIGSFLSIQNFSFTVTNFSINSPTSGTGTFTASTTATADSMTLFPSYSAISSTITGLTFNFNIAVQGNALSGALSISATSVSLTVANQLTITAGSVALPVVFSPESTTLLSIGTATVDFTQLNLLGSISGLTIQKITNQNVTNTVLTIADGALTGNFTNLGLGGVLTFQGAPTVTLSNLTYTLGGSLGGSISFGPLGVTLNLGSLSAGTVSASGIFSGSYDLQSGTLTGNLGTAPSPFTISVPGFVSVSGTLALFYQPSSGGTSTFLIGGQGINIFMGYNGGTTPVGVQVTNATFALAVFDTSGTYTFAFNATSSSISLTGLPNLPGSVTPLSITTGTVLVQFDNNGAVNLAVNVDTNPADAVQLNFTGNVTSLMVNNLTLNVAGLITLSGNFGFQTVTDAITGLVDDVVIGAANVNAMLGTPSGPNLTINGASLGLVLILPTSASPKTTFALMLNGGTDALNNIPNFSISSYTLTISGAAFTGLAVDLNTTPFGLGGTAWSLPNPIINIATPDVPALALNFGSTAVPGDLNFSTLGIPVAGIPFVGVFGPLSLNFAGLISLKGEFTFEPFTPVSATVPDLLIGATDLTITAGTGTTNLTIGGISPATGATLMAVIVPGASANLTTYALEATGAISLYGIPDFSLSGTAAVQINTTGVLPATLIPSTVTIPTQDGSVAAASFFSDFSNASNLTSIEGTLAMTVNLPGTTDTFVTLNGAFGFQMFADSVTGLTDFAIGASQTTITFGTASAGLTMVNASLALLIRSGGMSGGNPVTTTYALDANGGTDTLTLPDISQISFGATGFIVKINHLGVDPATLVGIPGGVQTAGGVVPLSFPGYGTRSFEDLEVTGISFNVGGFVTLTGNLAIQMFADPVTSGATDLAIAATGINAAVTAGGVSLTINGASLGLLVVPGSTTNYALVVNGGMDALTGINGLTLSATGLSVFVSSGINPATYLGTLSSIVTAAGNVSLAFPGLPTTGPVADVEGTITLSVANFASLSGKFWFQEFTATVNSAPQAVILAGASNITAVVGATSTGSTNLTIQGASLELLLVPGNGGPSTYALVANGGTDTLNGITGLSLSTSGLLVQINNNVSAALLTAANAQQVATTTGTAKPDFSKLKAGKMIEVEGTVTLNVAGFISLTGSFIFTEQTNVNGIEIDIGASGINAFLGTADGTVGVGVSGAELGMVIYENSTTNATTYALSVSAPLVVTGLPTEVKFTGTAQIAINTTGGALTTTINTPDSSVPVAFTAAQGKLKSFSVTGLTLTITPATGTSISLTGDFSFATTVVSGQTELLIGAANVSTSSIVPDVGASVAITNGSLGMVVFTNSTGGNAGYALAASATVTAALGSSSGSLTLTILRNTTTNAVNQTVAVGGASVPVVLTSLQVATTKPFQSIAVSSASLNIDNTLLFSATVTGSSGTTPGVTTQTLTGVTLTLQDPATKNIYLTLTAASASYSTVAGGIIYDNTTWGANGGYDVVLNNLSLSLGGYVVFNGTVDVQYNNKTSSSAAKVSFNFTSAAITFNQNAGSNPLVSVAGSFAFAYSSTAGLSLIGTPTISGVSFFGQTITPATTAAAATTASSPITTAAATSTSGTLGPVTLGSPGIGFSNFNLDTSGNLSVKVTISDKGAGINSTFGSVAVKASVDLEGSFTVGMTLNLQNPISAPTNIQAGNFALTLKNLNITVTITGASNITLTLTAASVSINPEAGPTDNAVTFAGTLSGSLAIGSLQFTCSAGNFAITGNGSFVALPGFSVSLSFGANTSETSFSWPSWLPLQNLSMVLTWTNFNSDPTSCLITLSATVSVTLPSTSLQITGNVTNLVIDVSTLVNGNFPIIGLGSVALNVSGNLFGGTVSGSLIIGVAQFDDNGKLVSQFSASSAQVGTITATTASTTVTGVGTLFTSLQAGQSIYDASGNLIGTVASIQSDTSLTLNAVAAVAVTTGAFENQPVATTTTTSTAAGIHSVFYAGIAASWTSPNGMGFAIQIGLTEYGPLTAYFSVNIPIPIGETGLILASFSGGVAFGVPLPTYSIQTDPNTGLPLASSALQLQTNAFTPLGQQTVTEWQSQLAQQAATLYAPSFKNGGTITNGWSNLGSAPILIQAGATLTAGDVATISADEAVFMVTATIDFDTTGKFLITGTATFGSSLTVNVSIYANLTPLFQNDVSTTNPVYVLFLLDMPPPPPLASLISLPLVQIYGTITFAPINNGLELDFAGEADLNLPGGLYAKLTGTISLIFTSTSFQMTLANAALNVSYLGTIGTAAGNLNIQKDGNGVDIWGALVVTLNVSSASLLPASTGISVSGEIEMEINTTAVQQSVTLSGLQPSVTEPDGTVVTPSTTVNLDPNSFSLLVTGGATVTLLGQQIFNISGTLVIDINSTSLTIFVQAILDVGPADFNYVSFNANGLLYVDQNGFAAMVTLSINKSLNLGNTLTYSMGGDFLLVMNTTGETNPIQFIIPTVAASPIPVVTGPDFTSSNLLAITNYENDAINPGKRTLVIPAGPPPSGTTDYLNGWINSTASITPGYYFLIVGRGSLTLGLSSTSLVITGNINIAASYSAGNIIFSFELNASLNLQVAGTNLFSFNVVGGIEISNAGLVAALNLSLNGGLPSGLGFSLSGSLTFTLEINTTGTAAQVPGTNITVQPGAMVAINGSLAIPGFTLSGEFDLTVTSTYLAVNVTASASVLGITLNVDGAAQIFYGANKGLALDLMLSVGSGAPGSTCTFYPISALGNSFVIQGTLELQLNTCSSAVKLSNGVTVQSGFLISLTNVKVYLFQVFELDGSASIRVSSAGFDLYLNVTLNFFNLVKLNVTGDVNSNGTFYFSASASFYYYWSIGAVSGDVYAYLTVSFWYYSSSNNGFSASAGCGIDIYHIGSLSLNATVTISSSEFYLNLSVDLVLFSATITIDLGPTSPPPAPPPPVVAWQNPTTHVVQLNFGTDVSSRGTDYPAQAVESYDVTESLGIVTVYTTLPIPGGSGSQTYTNTFTGVTGILVDNTRDYGGVTKSDSVTIEAGVLVPLIVNLGSNNTTIINRGSGATTVYNYGSGTNTITTGSGQATIYDYGTGSNTINVGGGGVTYYGGEVGASVSSATYSSKGITYFINSSNQVTVIESGYKNYTLSSTGLIYGSYSLNGVINQATLNGVSAGGTTFTFNNWNGTATVNGQGYNNTVVANPGGGAALTFALTNTSLQVKTNGTVTEQITLSGIQKANLTGGTGANTFNVSSWSGTANLNGADGNATYNLTLTGVGAGTINVLDATVNSNDVLNLFANASTIITSNQLTVGGQVVNYSAVATLNVTGTAAGLAYNVRSTNNTTTTTINAMGSGNVFNLGSTAGNAKVQAGNLEGILGSLNLNGGGQDMLNVDDSGNAGGLTGVMTPTTLDYTGLGTITYSGIAALTVGLGQGADTFTIADTITSASTTPVIVINSNGGNDTINVLDDHAVTVINGGNGSDTFNMTDDHAATTVNAGTHGSDTFIVTDDHALTTINGGIGSDSFNLLDDHGATIFNGGTTNNIFNIFNAHAVTTLNGGPGTNAFYIFGNSAQLNINGAGVDVYNLFASVLAGQTTYQINGPVTITGVAGGSDQLNIYGTVLNDTIVINGYHLTSLGLNVTFGNIANWALFGLAGNDTFYAQKVVVPTTMVGDGTLPVFALPAGLSVPDFTGGNTSNTFNDTYYIGRFGPNLPGWIAGINAPLTIVGGPGTDTAYVDDAADIANRTFTLTPGVLTSNAMGPNGQIVYDASLEYLNVFCGSGNDTLYVNNLLNPTVTTIDGGKGINTASLNFSGDFAAADLTLVRFRNGGLTVAGNYTGLLNDAGALTNVIIGGSMTGTGVLNVGSINTMTVGGDLAGLVNVTGLLNTLAITGGSPGQIIAGSINYITVQSGYGNKVLQVTEGGILRKILATPAAGGTLPGNIRFAFIYDSAAPGNPQLAIQITNSGTVVTHSFNLALTTPSAAAQFNLALVYATAATGLGNLSVTGDLLFKADAAELSFLHIATAPHFGVILPYDNITGLEFSGILPIGMVDVAGIEAIAFGLLETQAGQVVNILGDLGSAGNPQVLWNLLGSQAALLLATDAITVSFSTGHSVQLFAQCNSNPTLEYAMTFTDESSAGNTVTALVAILPATTTVQSISFQGDGGSVNSRYGVGTITSTGSLGNVTDGGALGGITAANIFGSILVNGGAITGTIQTTGLDTNPWTGVQTTFNADLGQFTYNSNGTITGVTKIYASGGITGTGRIISRGNLVSTVTSAAAFSGLIAAQGNIGKILTNASGVAVTSGTGQLTRYGGINVTGTMAGQVVALGNIFGDITITGSMTGRIAAQGQAVSGLSVTRLGILGNFHVTNNFAGTAAVVSGGLIGDALDATTFQAATVSGSSATGWLSADGAINVANPSSITGVGRYANLLGSANGSVLNAIFTDSSLPLSFDSGGTLHGLALILADLAKITVAAGKLSGTVP